ncbi:MAG TPA: DUF4293 domain-containing protein [Salinivirgaceae bacterium]|nr:DUF4293 domain-containing protein [Salinivirgaceae bacterium]
MIQRIQSVYLLVAIILASSLFFLPLADVATGDYFDQLWIYGLKSNPKLWLYTLFAPGVVLPLMQFFQFKNRKKQLFTGNIVLFWWIGWIIIFPIIVKFYLFHTPWQIMLRYPSIFPLMAFIFIILANRAIRKDEELVRSIDRIR